MTIEAIAGETAIFATKATSADRLTAAVYSSLAAAEPVWRDLETRAVMTPYQQFDWIDAYCKAGFGVSKTIAILVLSHQGKAIALIPFDIKWRFGARQARIIGMPISNCDSIVYDPDHAHRLTPDALREGFAALREHGVGADIVSFHSFLETWQDLTNPLLGFEHALAPNNFYFTAFKDSSNSFIEQALPHKRRVNIQRSQRRLIENHGDVSVRMARTADEIEKIHAVFLDQRGKRFREMGVENIFAKPEFQTLFRSAAINALGDSAPMFRYHALYAGDEIIATSLGLCTSTHYSQYINSTTSGPASKYSLMGVMLSLLIDELRAEGVKSFDMGLGDFGYKTDWTEAYPTYDSIIPISAIGKIAAPIVLGARKAKRKIKQTPAVWKVARALIAFKARLRDKQK